VAVFVFFDWGSLDGWRRMGLYIIQRKSLTIMLLYPSILYNGVIFMLSFGDFCVGPHSLSGRRRYCVLLSTFDHLVEISRARVNNFQSAWLSSASRFLHRTVFI